MSVRKIGAALAAFLITLVYGGLPALAQEAGRVVGAPTEWQLGLQQAASPIKAEVQEFHDLLLIIITAITLFVLGLLVYVMVRFNRRANPTPSTTTHHTWLEIAWTGIPVLILLVIAVPSFRLLYNMEKTANPGLTIKVTGHQWYWTYEYPDHGGITAEVRMIPEADIKPGQFRLLEVDNRIMVPVGVVVRVLVTGGDVIHSLALPALGVKKDAVPGRLNETWFRADREGVFYGQCSEICGTGHGYMPIAVEAVTKEKFDAWVASQKQAQNLNGAEPRQVADAAAGR